MSTHHLPAVATVANVNGQAWARSQDGSMRLLQQGDSVYEGEAVVTVDGVRVDLQLPDGTLYPVQGPLLAELDVPEDVPQRSADEAPEKVEVAES